MHVTRRRPVQLHPPSIPAATARPGDVAVFNLFDEVTLRGVLEAKVRDEAGAWTWVGGIKGELEGHFIFVVLRNIALANIRSRSHGAFQVRYTGGDVYTVRQVDESRFPRCGPRDVHQRTPLRLGLQAARGAAAPAPRALSDDGSGIDVLVVYTPTSRERLGGTIATEAEVILAVDEANETFVQSAIATRLRLVHQQEVDYQELGVWTGWDLFALTVGLGPAMREVHRLRDQYGADLVTLLADAQDVCGQAWVPPWPAVYFSFLGYSIVDWSCATGGYTYAHELGHCLGCNHDRDNTLFSFRRYAYGYRFTGIDGTLYRTVMAYPPGERTPHFSNPDIRYAGVPTGVPLDQPQPGHNAKIINDSAEATANFRASQ